MSTKDLGSGIFAALKILTKLEVKSENYSFKNWFSNSVPILLNSCMRRVFCD